MKAKTLGKVISVLLSVCMLVTLFTCLCGLSASAAGTQPDLVEINEAGEWTCLKYTKAWSTIPAGNYRFTMDCKIFSGTPVIQVGNDEIGTIIEGYQTNYVATYDSDNFKYIITFTLTSDFEGCLGALVGNYGGSYGNVYSHFACANPELYLLDGDGNPTGSSLINTFATSYYSTKRTANKWTKKNLSGANGSVTCPIPDGYFNACAHDNTTVVPAVASTCTTAGHAEYTVCDDCGAIVSGSDAALPLDPANHEAGTDVEATVSTCTTAGHAAYTVCSGCGAVLDGSADALPLDPDNHTGEGSEVRDVVAATCTEAGYTGNTYCTGCNAKLSDGEVIAALGHNYVEAITLPTCTEAGYTTHTCSRCGDSYITDQISATGHNVGDWLSDAENHWKVCENCAAEIDKAAHTFDDGVVTAPNCTEAGSTVYTCTVCGYSYNDEIEALGHTGGTATCHSKAVCTTCGAEYGEFDPNNHDGGTEVRGALGATYKTEGYTGDTYCLGCGEKLASGTAIAKIYSDMVTFDGTDWSCFRYTKGWSTIKAGNYRFTMDCKIISGIPCIQFGSDQFGTVIDGQTNYVETYDAVNRKYTITFTMTDDWTGNLGAIIGNFGPGNRKGDCTGDAVFACACPELYLLDDEGNPTGSNLITPFASANYSTSRAGNKWNRRNSGWTCTEIPDGYFDPCTHTESTVVPAVASTCSTAGHAEYTVCNDCGTVLDGDDTPLALDPNNHEEEIRGAIAATCTEAGYTGDIYCGGCGIKISDGEVIAALGHDYVAVVTEPTCTEAGYTTHTCSRCDDSYVTDQVSATGHSVGDWLSDAENHWKVCENCAAEIDKAAHIPSGWILDAAATTEATGLKHKECTICGAILESEIIAKIEMPDIQPGENVPEIAVESKTMCAGNTVDVKISLKNNPGISSMKLVVTYGSGLTLKSPVVYDICDENNPDMPFAMQPASFESPVTLNWVSPLAEKTGDTVYATLTFEIAADAEGDQDVTVFYNPKDVFNANEENVAFAVTNGKVTVAADHSFTNYVSNNDATCTADGTKTAKCDYCDVTDTITDEGSALGHSFTNYVSNNDATCTADGTKTAKCDRCDATDTIADEGTALGHSFTNYVSNNDATCTADGTKTAKCDRCDATDTTADEGSATGHSVGEWLSDEENHWHVCESCSAELDKAAHTASDWIIDVEATAEAEGHRYKACTVCGRVLEEEIIPKLVTHVPGDINGDGVLNNKDLSRFFQYLSDWDVEVNEAALDVNGDGAVNNKDLTRLFQYLSDWDVEIF